MKPEDFMLKEYEQIYELYKIHYDYSDKLINHFLLVIGVFFTIGSYVYKDHYERIDIYHLNSVVLYCLFISNVTCTSFYLMLIEHRLKILLYARTVNGIRSWVVDKHKDLKPFLVLPHNIHRPKYFELFNGFFWELLTFGMLNSILIGLFLVNIISISGNINKKQATVFYLIFVFVFTGIHVLIYRRRGKNKIITRNEATIKLSQESSNETPVTPSFHGENCIYNGEHDGIECRCEECDFYLECFPDWKDIMK